MMSTDIGETTISLTWTISATQNGIVDRYLVSETLRLIDFLMVSCLVVCQRVILLLLLLYVRRFHMRLKAQMTEIHSHLRQKQCS